MFVIKSIRWVCALQRENRTSHSKSHIKTNIVAEVSEACIVKFEQINQNYLSQKKMSFRDLGELTL